LNYIDYFTLHFHHYIYEKKHDIYMLKMLLAIHVWNQVLIQLIYLINGLYHIHKI